MDQCAFAQLEWSWIQGHPELGFNFKALACHDGVSFYKPYTFIAVHFLTYPLCVLAI